MRLLVDAGNTRLKWALVEDGRPGEQSAVAHDGDTLAALRATVAGLAAVPEEIILVDVTGRLDLDGLPPLRRVIPTAHCAGVTNAYADPARLGADRWAAMLAARSLAGGEAVCIVDCGSAVTLDLLDADGRHLGGAITPGLSLQRDALHHGTFRVGLAAKVGAVPVGAARRAAIWGEDTATAVHSGTLLSLEGFVTAGVAAARRELGAGLVVLLTGGDAPWIRDRIAAPCKEVPDLVLQGAYIWAEH